MSFAELLELYRSNEAITAEDEKELSRDIPDPESIISPTDYSRTIESIHNAKQKLTHLTNTAKWSFVNNSEDHTITFQRDNRNFELPYPEVSDVLNLKAYATSFEKFEPWMR
jgi:hypothetical protein